MQMTGKGGEMVAAMLAFAIRGIGAARLAVSPAGESPASIGVQSML